MNNIHIIRNAYRSCKMKKSKIDKIETIYRIAIMGNLDKEITTEINFKNMQILRKNGFESIGKWWTTNEDKPLPIKTKIPLCLHPEFKITRKTGMIVYRPITEVFT